MLALLTTTRQILLFHFLFVRAVPITIGKTPVFCILLRPRLLYRPSSRTLAPKSYLASFRPYYIYYVPMILYSPTLFVPVILFLPLLSLPLLSFPF